MTAIGSKQLLFKYIGFAIWIQHILLIPSWSVQLNLTVYLMSMYYISLLYIIPVYTYTRAIRFVWCQLSFLVMCYFGRCKDFVTLVPLSTSTHIINNYS